MKNLTHIIDEIGMAAADVTKLCISARAYIAVGEMRIARHQTKELLRVVRQIGVMSNVVREVMDASDLEKIAAGDLEAATEVYQEERV